MGKRLLFLGYKVDTLKGFENIQKSNFTIKFTSESSWKKKIKKIQQGITNCEFFGIVIVICRNFFKETEDLEDNHLQELIALCKQTKCLIVIQEYLMEEEPIYIDYVANKKYSFLELNSIVSQLREKVVFDQSEISETEEERPFLNMNKSRDFSDALEDVDNADNYNNFLIYKEAKKKLLLLQETVKMFPKIKNTIESLSSAFESRIIVRFLNQISELAKSEIIELLSNEILNIYIPKQYGYSLEFNDFIQLFERYLKNVEQLKFSVEVNETSLGVNYKFISNEQIESISDLPNKFNRFSQFIDLCENSPEKAFELIENKYGSPEKALEIIQRLATKYKRFVLDIQQRKERLELSFKQEIQAELLELKISETPFSLISQGFSIKSLDSFYQHSDEELQLISIVDKYGMADHEHNNIKSDMQLLNDPEIKLEERRRTAYKVTKLLNKILFKGIEYSEKIAIQAAIEYIKHKIV